MLQLCGNIPALTGDGTIGRPAGYPGLFPQRNLAGLCRLAGSSPMIAEGDVTSVLNFT
jgi:hypothetical protein